MTDKAQTSLIVDVRPGDRLIVGSPDACTIEMVEKSGKIARLRINAPREVEVRRVPAQCRDAQA